MAKNQPVQLRVVSGGRVSQYNKQKIQAIHPNGTQFEVNLGDKSPKVAEGQMNVNYMFEIWQYTPPGKAPLWCGKLVQAQQPGPQNDPQYPSAPQGGQWTPPRGPQSAPQATQRDAQAPPNNKEVDWDAKDLRMARECGLNCATRLVCLLGELNKDNAVGCNASTIKTVAAEFVDYIYNGLKSSSQADAREFEEKYGIDPEGQGETL